MAALAEKLPATNSDADWPDEIKKLVVQLNGFLETCAEYPQVFLARSPGMPPRLVQEFAPATPSGTVRHNAISATCALVRYGLLDRVRRCHRCERWFFAKKSDSKYCSRGCQTKPSEENKRRKREYAKRYYREEKEREQRAELKVRGGRK